MGTYTEVYVDAEFMTKDMPDDFKEVLQAVADHHCKAPALEGYPNRWWTLLGDFSFLDSDFSGLIGKGEIRNYDEQVEQFFNFLDPFVEPGFIGWFKNDLATGPTLVFKDEKVYFLHIQLEED
jgi:hypothetical protein